MEFPFPGGVRFWAVCKSFVWVGRNGFFRSNPFGLMGLWQKCRGGWQGQNGVESGKMPDKSRLALAAKLGDLDGMAANDFIVRFSGK